MVTRTRPDLRIGYLPQGFDIDPALTFAEACAPTLKRDMESELANLASALVNAPSDANLQMAYDDALRRVERSNVQPVNVLTSLGLIDIPLDKCVGELSGGQKTRLMLARLC